MLTILFFKETPKSFPFHPAQAMGISWDKCRKTGQEKVLLKQAKYELGHLAVNTKTDPHTACAPRGNNKDDALS